MFDERLTRLTAAGRNDEANGRLTIRARCGVCARAQGCGAMAESVVLEEEIDQNYEPTQDEIIEYATWLGMVRGEGCVCGGHARERQQVVG